MWRSRAYRIPYLSKLVRAFSTGAARYFSDERSPPSVRILPTMVPVRVAYVDNSNHLAPSECVRTMLLVDPVQSSSPSVTLSCTTPFLRIHVRSTGVLLYGRRQQALELGRASRADAASRAGRREGYLCACSPHEKQTFVLDV